MLIRPVQSQDLNELRAIAESTFRCAWGAMNSTDAFEQYCKTRFSLEHIAREMNHPGSYFYFAEWEDKVVAYLKINEHVRPDDFGEFKDKCLQLERIYVKFEYRSSGFGTSMLKFVEYYAKDAHFDWIWLSVWQEAPAAIRFYEKNGYAIFGTEDFWLGDERQTDWILRKKI